MANTRIPYHSTLVGLDAGPTVRGEKQWQDWAQDFVDWEDNRTAVANSRIPYHSTLLDLDADPAWPVRGEKQWQTWAQEHVDWEDHQTDVANTRIPYHSNVQLSEDSDDDELEFDEPEKRGEPVKLEVREQSPLDFHFVHISNDEGELVKIEDNKGVPLNFRF